MAKTDNRPAKHEKAEGSWRKVEDWGTSTIADQVSLVKAALAGDGEAAGVFHKAYWRFIRLNIESHLAGSPLYSEDAVQELSSVLEEKLLVNMRKLKRVGNWCATLEKSPLRDWAERPEVDVDKYIGKVAYNFMKRELKNRDVLPPSKWDYDSERLEAMECSPEKDRSEHTISSVWAAVPQLEDELRKVMTLHLKRYTGKKIASELGISEATVSRLLKEARRKIKKILGEMDID